MNKIIHMDGSRVGKTSALSKYRADLEEKAWNEKRERLEAVLIQVALDLFAFSGANAFRISIPGTEPKVWIKVGPE